MGNKIGWLFAIGVLILISILILLTQGCASMDFPDESLTPCQSNSVKTAAMLETEGYRIRIGHGTFKGRAHQWVEYEKDGQWLVAKDTVWYVNPGYPIESYKTGDKYDYWVVWYGYYGANDLENEQYLCRLGIKKNTPELHMEV